MNYFFAYDIANPKRLNKVSKTLENFGIRIQYSFFQCEMQKEMMEKLRDKILSIMNLKEDCLHIYPLCEDCLRLTQTLGEGSIYVPTTFEIL